MTKEEKAQYDRAYRARNRDIIAAKKAAYAKLNRDKIRATRKAWYQINKEKVAEDGRAYRAKNFDRLKAKSRRYVEENRAAVAERKATYYQKNRAALLKRQSEWVRKNPSAKVAAKRRWYLKNTEKFQAYRENRRSRQAGGGGSYSASDVKQMFARQLGQCVHCRTDITKRFEVDHIVPIKLGGSSDPTNLQLLCMPCNRSKGALSMEAFVQRGVLTERK